MVLSTGNSLCDALWEIEIGDEWEICYLRYFHQRALLEMSAPASLTFSARPCMYCNYHTGRCFRNCVLLKTHFTGPPCEHVDGLFSNNIRCKPLIACSVKVGTHFEDMLTNVATLFCIFTLFTQIKALTAIITVRWSTVVVQCTFNVDWMAQSHCPSS